MSMVITHAVAKKRLLHLSLKDSGADASEMQLTISLIFSLMWIFELN